MTKQKALTKCNCEPVDFETINQQLVNVLPNDQWDNVMYQEYCDIDPSFVGFVNHYYHLSKIIPKGMTVIDIGCAFAPQSYYFQEHKQYIGIDDGLLKYKFTFDNSLFYNINIHKFMKEVYPNKYKEQKESIFWICNYMPYSIDDLRQEFKHIYYYYPHESQRSNEC